MPDSDMRALLSLSTITPVYSGEEYLKQLVTEIQEVRQQWNDQGAPITLAEAIFVDDGSVDNSNVVLKQLADTHDWVQVVTLSRNYGTHSATAAGIVASRGDWVVTMDEDLQHRPMHIKDMLRTAINHSADVVYAEPLSKVHGGSWRDLGSKSVKSLLATLASTPQIRMFNSFRLLRGDIGRAAAGRCTSQTYFDMALTWFTSSVQTLPLELRDHRYIEKKTSGFRLGTLVAHAKKLMISSKVNIATKGLYLGVATILIAAMAGIVVVFQHFFFPGAIQAKGWVSLMVLLSFFSGVILSILCLALEYVNILLQQQMGFPNYNTINRSQDSLLEDWLLERVKDPG